MLRSAGLWRALLHRSRSDWPVVLAAGLLLLCATVLLAAGAVYGDVVALGGLRQAILDAPPPDRVVVIGSSAAPADVGAIDDVVTSEANEVFGVGRRRGRARRDARRLVPQGADPTDQAALSGSASYRGIADHAELVDGAWPAAGRAASRGARCPQGAAAALGLERRRHDQARQPRRPGPRSTS